jgi:hypothetical protein
MPTDQGPDQFKESCRISGIDVELLGYPGNGAKKWIKCRRVKANLVAITLNRGDSRTCPHSRLVGVVCRDFYAAGINTDLTARVHDQRTIAWKPCTQKRLAGARFRRVEEADTGDEFGVALARG